MSELDLIYEKRLENIRKELDAYIEAKLFEENADNNVPIVTGSIIEQKAGEGYQKEKAAFRCQSQKILQSPKADMPIGGLRIPEFLSRDRKDLNIDKVLEQREESFSSMLLRLIDERGLKDSAVYKSANIDRRLFSKIRGDENYVPSKKTAISFCLALQLGMDETKKLLETAGYTLSGSSRFDLIIMYLIENGEYNIHFANIVLDDYGVGTLSR